MTLSTAENAQSYLVLARRTRPQSFSELVGQESISQALENILSQKKIPHAFLFTGTRGTGKTSSARILAKSLCCESGPTLSPCQTCVHCRQITACSHDDILEIDGASHTGVENIRELRESARFYPNSARYKIFIIDEVHMLSMGAFNALLKTLEEPPPAVVFILATTELQKVPVTVRSRCLIFPFKKIATDVIASHLQKILEQEKINYEPEALTLIAREGKGSLRDALSLLEQAIATCAGSQKLTLKETRQGLSVQGESIAQSLAQAICQGDSGNALHLLSQADAQNIDIGHLLESTAQLFRSCLLIKSLLDKERTLRLTNLLPNEYDFLKTISHPLSLAAVTEIFKSLSYAARDILKTNAALSWAEVAVIECLSQAQWLSSAELISLLNSNGEVGSSQQPLTPPPVIQQAPFSPSSSSSERVTGVQSVLQKTENKNSEHIYFEDFKKLVTLTETKSKTLSVRLTLAKLDRFTKAQVIFSDVPENKSHLALSEDDLMCLRESLLELGYGDAQVKGFGIPPDFLRKEQKQSSLLREAKSPVQQKAMVLGTPSSITPQTISASFKQVLNKATAQSKSSDVDGVIQRQVSLHEVTKEIALEEFKKKEAELLASPELKILSALASEIKITPLV
ncbi:MAG: DNA polymerase III subunit gamma/tau [Silvanigrellaceae bacterium]|nr:DNA polymerase III subunit gamma/tau [Silvanigrellaceae bacterium]